MHLNNSGLAILLLALLTACAPTRYPPNHPLAHQASPTLGHGGHVKRGEPYEIAGVRYYPLASGENYDEEGVASWYGKKFHGRKTANGERYNMYAMTAAHTTLPLPSVVLVTNLENGKQIKVRVNDRGPFVKNRVIDLSYSAAKALGYTEQGTTRVRVQTLGKKNAPKAVSKAEMLPVTTVVKTSDVVDPVQAITSLTQEPRQLKPTLAEPEMAYIQVGAFSAKENADSIVDQLQSQLSANHPPLRIILTQGVHRVRLGPFDLDEDAQKALQTVRRNGYDKAMIIHD